MSTRKDDLLKVAVVIPAFKVSNHIVDVVKSMPENINLIIVVDDACPERSGDVVLSKVKDKRLVVIKNLENLGVGGAMKAGYREALDRGAEVIVKVDGDGQMDTTEIERLIYPLASGRADYSKGNRFDQLDHLFAMPKIRLIGNAFLSLLSKISSGYWSITDPTNGFTAITRQALKKMELMKVSNRYFFESDMLFRLNLAGALVQDVPMRARYGSEKSNLSVGRSIFEFGWKHFVNFNKRIFYRYYLREWSIASFEWPLAIFFLAFGGVYGLNALVVADLSGNAITAGQVTLTSLTMIMGLQLFLAFVSYDVQSEPRDSLQQREPF